jgi:pheromone shutdown protein TraB
MYSTLRAMQQTVVRLYGLDPGKTDMETAIETAAELDLDVALIDEPITETVSALLAQFGPEALPRLFVRLQRLTPAEFLDALFGPGPAFETVESGDDVQPTVDRLRRLFPEVAGVLIDDRDQAMAARLDRLRREGYDVVAVIGAGHHNGIVAALEELEGEPTPDVDVPIRSPLREGTVIPIS